MHIFKYMYLNACVYSNILKLLCISISKFELLLFTKHSLSGLGSSPRDAPGTVQLLAEPLMKAVVPFFGSRALKPKQVIDGKAGNFSDDCLKPISLLASHYTNSSCLLTERWVPGTTFITKIIRITRRVRRCLPFI